jgi:hypothetical protein
LDIFPINYPGLKIIHKNCEINKGIRQIEDSFRDSREKRPQDTKTEGKGIFVYLPLPIVRSDKFTNVDSLLVNPLYALSRIIYRIQSGNLFGNPG